MRTNLPLYLCAVLAVCAADCVRAKGPASGKIAILDNDRTLEGEIEKVGEQYRVRRAIGVTYLPAGRVVKLCADKADALAFLRGRTNLQDPDERLKLSRWCHVQGLRAEAHKEAKAALKLRPEHVETQRLCRYLEESVDQPGKTVKAPAEAETPARAETRPPPSITITGDALSLFTMRVQPILMNACIRCHASSESSGAFRLVRNQGGLANRRALQENLAAVLAQLNGGQPERSPLLVKAVSAHGPTGDAPLKGRQLEAFRVLEDWVKLTLEKNPHLQESLRPPAQLLDAPPPAAPRKSEPATRPASAPVRADVPVLSAPPPDGPAPVRPVAVTSTPTPAPAVEPGAAPKGDDEYDHDSFNRAFHPQRFKPAPRDRE